METPPIDRYGNGKVVGFQLSTRSESISEAGGGWVLELETKVHSKVRNHGEGPY